MSLVDLRPARKEYVFDLVQEVGIDVSDWITSARLCAVRANPKYCYEWAFVEPGKVVALNLWFRNLREENGAIVHRWNFRQDAIENRGKPTWVKRAIRMDNAVQAAVRDGLEVRVIINDGSMRRNTDAQVERSHVTARQLDTEPWTVTNYDWNTGAHLITRGSATSRFVDQFDLANAEEIEAERRHTNGLVFVRDPAIRRAALNRANGRCEFCGEPGFDMANGAIYLETHHVVPLCEGGADRIGNVAALCPNDHKRAHFAADRASMRDDLLKRI